MITKIHEDQGRWQLIKSEFDSDLKRKIWTKAKKVSQVEGFRYFKTLYSKLLNLLGLLSNSKAYFKELLNYDEFVLILLESLNFDDTYISYQSSQILKSLISFKSKATSKFEKSNKERLLAPNINLIGHIKKLLQRWDKRVELNPNDLRVLEINGAFMLLLIFLKDDKAGPGQNYSVNSFEKFIADAIFEEDKSLFHLLDKLALKGLFSVSYSATLLMSRAVDYYQKSTEESERRKEEQCKNYIMNHSVQFIWNIYLLMKWKFEEQIEESLSFISNLLHRNKQAVNLISRMFQKALFYKVEGADDLFKNYSWSKWEWEQFFEKLKSDYNSSTCQWNHKTRKELHDWILIEIDNFVSVQKKFKQAKSASKVSFPSMSLTQSSKVVSTIEYLKWNWDEFEVDYPSLK